MALELTPEQIAQAEAIRIQVEAELELGREIARPALLERQDWARYYFPHSFTRPFTSYQEEFWDWGWTIEADNTVRPRVECEPRGVGKSTNAEAWVVSLVARRKRKMIGYVSLDEDKAGKHFDSIRNLLESERLLRDYPHCRPKVQKLRNAAAQWSREAIVTESDAMIVPLSLLGSSRGWKSPNNERFDVIVLDDIDKLGTSVRVIKKNLELLKSEILAAGTAKTVVLMPQNLIHRDSICTMIFDQRADILTNRIFRGPYPLLKLEPAYQAEKVPVPGDDTGATEWVITSGEPFDGAVPIDYCQSLLTMLGKSTFDRECQQDVHRVEDDKDFREWDEKLHVVTYSEFRRYFEQFHIPVWNLSREHPQIPPDWNVGLGLDWGTTLGHPAACVAFARPPERAPLNDCYFGFMEVVLPKYPHPAGEEPELVSPGRVAAAIRAGLKEWNVSWSQVRQALMSHEASAAKNTFILDLPEDLKVFFNKWKAKRGSGVPQVQQMLEVDRSKPHPFREGRTGRPRFYLLVPDDQGRITVDPQLGGEYVAPGRDRHGFARLRYEIPLYNHRNTGADKIDDDAVDGLLGLANVFMVTSQPKSERERREERLPEHLQDVEGILKERPEIAERAMLARTVEFGKMDREDAARRAAVSKMRPQIPRVGLRRGR
jgi:hypothetical protein